MSTILASLLSVFLVILVGAVARQTRFLDEKAWAGFEAVTYHLLFPAVIIHTLAFAQLEGLPVLRLGGALALSVLVIGAGLVLMRRPLERMGLDGPAFTSVFQGATRWNTFIALAIVAHSFGQTGVALMAVAIAALIPLLNVMCVLVLQRYAQGGTTDLRTTLLTLIRNPFIWSCLVGFALHPVSGFIPTAVASALDIIGKASLAGGLLVVGAGLDLKRLARPRAHHWLSISLKLMVMPIVIYAIASALGLSGTALAVAMIVGTVPTATGAYILARQMGGDAPLMAEIVTLQTVLALLTLPAILLATTG
jgi:predicted permease